MANDEISSELVQEGRDLMVREKRKRQRIETRRRDFTLRDVTTGGRGLLREGSGNVGYNTNANTEDLSPEYNGRSLSQEIHARFGVSTDVNFQPDYNEQNAARPRNIFDDV